jgi:hypothetical protein
MFPQGRINYFAHCIGFGLPTVPTRGVPISLLNWKGGGAFLIVLHRIYNVSLHTLGVGSGEESDALTNVPFRGIAITLLHLCMRGLHS